MEHGCRLMKVLRLYRSISPVHPLRLATNNLHGRHSVYVRSPQVLTGRMPKIMYPKGS